MKMALRTCVLALLCIGLSVADAQAQLLVGPRAGYDIDVENAFIGAEARLSVDQLPIPITINPYADYFLVNSDVDEVLDGVEVDQRLVAIGANAIYEIGAGETTMFTPYAGAGVNVAYSAVETTEGDETVEARATDVGMNLVGGAYFGTGTLRPFAEARFTTFTERNLLSLSGGVLIRLGGS